jgi:hypothetical protein
MTRKAAATARRDQDTNLSRRDWLTAASTYAFARLVRHPVSVLAQRRDRSPIEARIARVIQEYEQQGFHRTGTAVDRQSGDWLFDQAAKTGVTPAREAFALSRVDPVSAFLVCGDHRVEGLPLFDGGFTDAVGVLGRLGVLGADADVGFAQAAPNTAAAGPLGDARRKNAHKAIVCITRGGRPGLCPNNADLFPAPFGPPVLQVSSEETAWLDDRARQGADVQVVAHVKRTAATAFNVTARIDGIDRALPPLVVMTPRSGWYSCASERGGGIACWLELMRTLRSPRPRRDVIFVASSGHELGHLGINAFVDRRPSIVSASAAWMHFGANIGAATDPGTTVQASDDDGEALLAQAMAAAGLAIDRRVPRGTIPGGEAEVVHRGGGRYVSVIGRNALFHNPDDRGAQSVNLTAIATFVEAFTVVARAFAGNT